MPVYEYLCDRCGGFQSSQPIARAAVPQPCPDCGEPAPRALAAPHVRGSRAAVHYTVGERNERSANEPPVEHRLKGTSEHHHAHRTKAHPSGEYVPVGHAHRPWMVGH